MRKGPALIWTNCTFICPLEADLGAHWPFAGTIKAAFSRLIVYSSVCPILTCVCVDALCVRLLIVCVCLPLQGGAWGPRGVDGRGGGWVGGLVFGPHLPGSSLCSRNLSSSLLRQWGEHVRLWHMVARVTCSLCLALNFWPSEQNLPTLTTPALLHLPPCSLSTL